MSVAVLVVMLVGAISPAFADPTTEANGSRDTAAWTDGEGVGARATSSGASNASAPGPTSPDDAPACTYQSLSAEQSAIADKMAQAGMGPAKGNGDGSWVRESCVDAAGHSSGTVFWSPRRAPVDAAALAEQALQYTPLAVPGLGMSPAPDRDQLVNVPTWLWIDAASWQPISASASAGGVRVTTTATPVRVVWDMGDGSGRVSCDGPGDTYDPAQPTVVPTCAYTYRHPSDRAVVTATVAWSVRWASTGGDSGDLGIVRRSASLAVRVAESQAINTFG